MKLAIISHTEHYTTDTGTLVGWGATVNEINHLLEVFDTIYHVAMLHTDTAPPSASPYVSDKIVFVPVPTTGGRTLKSKLDTLVKAPTVVKIINSVLKDVDCFQLRTPTGMGVYLIPYLSWFVKKPGWYKYAGNWSQKQAPLGYALQRWMLKLQGRKVTINGKWPDQPDHHISFENPCLTMEDIAIGKRIRSQKKYTGALNFCFVGRLEEEKGVERIIKAFNGLSEADSLRVGTVHLVGEGTEMPYFKALAAKGSIKYIFHGALSRMDVFDIYRSCEVFVLPTTASEGFPKVIVEAMNFGCLPVVSKLSAIGHYIKNDENGFLLDPVTIENLMGCLQRALYLEPSVYKKMLTTFDTLVLKFTYAHYNEQIKKILSV
ncbi:glycosyltransferase [Snuella sedimenti]|uniref:Glycosyltransferase family 4 protein n=1 Tax=Snuella sedimenti TaxID=2798802 RepID=A0A8J7JBX7_9FLAO|nr:glycosyltransferase [Snuella sedimenti]MBJ6368284.1 glycosyltransferase family 4 protein [Snuella sedimenti]